MRFIAFILAAALCVAPASAVDVYDLRSDVQFMSLNSGLATAAADDSWYDSMLTYQEWMAFDIADLRSLLVDIDQGLGFTIKETLYDAIYEMIAQNSSALEYLADLSNALGVYDYDFDSGSFVSFYEFLYLIHDSLDDVETLITGVNSSFNSVFSSSGSFFDFFTLSSGKGALTSSGSLETLSSDLSFMDFLNRNFRAIWQQFYVGVGNSILMSNGNSAATTNQYTIAHIIRNGFLGLSTNLKSVSNNVKAISTGSYSVDLFDSELGTSGAALTVDSMGSMIDKYLDAMQDDLGALTFIHADPDTVQAKKDALDNEVAVTDSFLSPGSAGSLSVSDIGDAANAVGGTKDLFDTGVSVGQAFEQLQGSGPLEFFTSVTASNLNTVPAAASDLEDDDFVHFYDPSNSEFFELIGKGSG